MQSISSDQFSAIKRDAEKVKVPGAHDKVYKDECLYTFTTAEHPDGLFVNLASSQAVSKDFLRLERERTGCGLFLHQKRLKFQKRKEKASGHPEKMAIGVEGGFQLDEDFFRYETQYSLYIETLKVSIPYPFTIEIPESFKINECIKSLIASKYSTQMSPSTFVAEERITTKYADDLIQLDNGIKISSNPKDWKCSDSGLSENVWLNLSTGYIGSGRQYFDGSGGTGAALKHYEETGKIYHLAVKLGTITADSADVYSYADDEDCLVIDPKLDEHLEHWGIHRKEMRKTDKTMEEMEIDANMKLDLMAIQEDGKDLKKLSGAGYIGLVNTGNSCYINSVLQVLFSLPEFEKRYSSQSDLIFQNFSSPNPATDLNSQLAKVAVALCTEKYTAEGHTVESCIDDEWDLVPYIPEIAPKMLQQVVGAGHPEFSTSRQQDAHEYFQHLLDCIHKAEKSSLDQMEPKIALKQLFSFSIQERVCCDQSGMVKYVNNDGENTLALPIAMDKVQNHEERENFFSQLNSIEDPAFKKRKLQEEPRALVNFSDCLEAWLASEKIEGFMSSATGQRGPATKTIRFGTFPPYLCIKLCRYVVSENWAPKKLDALVNFPEFLDLSSFRGKGLQLDETELPETKDSQSVADPLIVSQLCDFGMVGENGCKRAAIATNNAGVEVAVNWILEHIGDADINDPIGGPTTANPESLMLLQSMGFSSEQAVKALEATSGDVARATDWLFSREGQMDVDEPTHIDGDGKYELVAIISHIGSNTFSGHYVCHVKKPMGWTLFNDRKVFQSETPPFDKGYLYFYKRAE